MYSTFPNKYQTVYVLMKMSLIYLFTLTYSLIMAQMFTVSDNDSESSDDQEDSLKTHKELPQRKQQVTVSAHLKRRSQVPVG